MSDFRKDHAFLATGDRAASHVWPLPFDHAEITSLAGATIALELICLMARQRGA